MHSYLRVSAAFAAALAFLMGSLPAQACVAPGYGIESRWAYRQQPEHFVRTAAGDVVYAAGTLSLDVRGSLIPLLTLPNAPTLSFLVEVRAGTLVLGVVETGEIWAVSTSPLLPPRMLASLPGHVDGTQLDAGRLLISREVAGSPGRGEVVTFDLASAATDRIVGFLGYPGPVHHGANGVWVSLTSVPPPAPGGSMRLALFDDPQIATAVGPSELALRDAALSATGLDPARDIAGDTDFDVYVVSALDGGIDEVEFDIEPTGFALLGVRPLVEYPFSGESAVQLQFDPDAGGFGTAAFFEAFEQRQRGRLYWLERDGRIPRSLVVSLASRPATLISPAAAGQGLIQFELSNAPFRGVAVAVVGLQRSLNVVQGVPGFDQAIIWNLGLQLGPTDQIPFVLDGSPRVPFQYLNPGGLPPGLEIHLQVAFVDDNATAIGATELDTVVLY